MISNLEFLRKETTKLQKSLEDINPKNYKKYATLLNSYFNVVATFNQTEAIIKNQEAERKRQREIEESYQEAEKELEEKTCKKCYAKDIDKTLKSEKPNTKTKKITTSKK